MAQRVTLVKPHVALLSDARCAPSHHYGGGEDHGEDHDGHDRTREERYTHGLDNDDFLDACVIDAARTRSIEETSAALASMIP